MLPAGIRSVHVPAFINQCGEPRADTEATRATIQEFQKDGSLRIAQAGQADAVLKVTLRACKLKALRYDEDNPKATREYRLILRAHLVFEDAKTGNVLLEKTVQGDSTFELTGDLAVAKRQALPESAQDLAHDIVESVVEGW